MSYKLLKMIETGCEFHPKYIYILGVEFYVNLFTTSIFSVNIYLSSTANSESQLYG